MAESCEHLMGLTPEDFPSQKTPNACEECLTEGTVWVALRECRSAAMSAVAIPRPAGTRPSISMRRNIRLCALSRRRLGYGAMSMRHRIRSVNSGR